MLFRPVSEGHVEIVDLFLQQDEHFQLCDDRQIILVDENHALQG